MSIENEVCLARQPILNKNNEIIAYELLFRDCRLHTSAQFPNATEATATVLINLFNNMGFEQVLGDKLAFINLDTYLLQNDILELLPPQNVVLEILETVKVTPGLIHYVKKLTQKGYVFALDDFIYSEDFQPLLSLCSIMKIDITQLDRTQLAKHVALGKRYNMQLLAERVETQEEVETCKALGFDYFQGYFFAKPLTLSQKNIPQNKLPLLNAMQLLMSDDADNKMKELEEIVSHDVGLSYKLLKFLNSPIFGTRKIQSIKEALVFLGNKQLYRWLSLLLFSNSNGDPASQSLLSTALIRATFLEELAKIKCPKEGNNLYLLGLFSYLEALLNIPIAQILDKMLVPHEIEEALLSQSGKYQPYLQLVLLLENSQSEQIPITITKLLDLLGLSINDINQAQLQAMQVANTLLKA